ncbi:DUF1631 domain-containing protein [Verminephrobacter aporrectodeae subsp. tuberculatae]|uniref:DUF1631 domain-containing protein n=1 Tax=Verminephrobacter aporrectodeae TaxID=1110389 RepID=UPI002237A541|nr:DUF1631 domain-containing protein [Verminephrobacter aporrectodeae]MCW5258236.1 DUF1631 domain-containing protein [Verminephrobacter aporrectodeae subsp. tuberculatae]
MQSTPASAAQRRLAGLARQRFVEGLCAGLPSLDQAVQNFLRTQMSQAGTGREMQSRHDAWMHYQRQRTDWIGRTGAAWRAALAPHPGQVADADGAHNPFELLSDDVMENKVQASRMALMISEQLGQDFDQMRQCTQSLEERNLVGKDILWPDGVCLRLVEQWGEAGLSRGELRMVFTPLQRGLAHLLQQHYQAMNAFYAAQGVTPADLRSRIRHTTGGGGLPHPNPPSSQSRLHAAQCLTGGSPPPPRAHAQHAPPAAGRTPLAHLRQQAQGVVLGQLLQLLAQPAPGLFGLSAPARPSPALAHALALSPMPAGASGVVAQGGGPQAVVQLVSQARKQSTELKQKAETGNEKVVVEVLALMFQSILTEERIPPAVRVWFARLQVPVLRVALAEPAFFSNPDHPARKLIDRMGACAMGFDAAAINGSALEAEIRRIVQVIEQYPETGSRVFQLVYDEFEKFLSRFLTEKQTTARVVSVAQQVEQKAVLTIQYTIELRDLLRDVPVRDEIREFLFRTWAEVLALSAVRHGAQHADTVAYKHAAANLVWAVSAKPKRSDRARLIQNLPTLLRQLRQGLTLMGVDGAAQNAQIKVLTDTLADAFQSKTAAIPQAHLDAMVERLVNLEDLMGDATLGEVPLNVENVEMLLGIDASSIHVLADNGARVDDAMLAWAQELQPGAWYTLDHNGGAAHVQYIWQSQRNQLHLFAAVDGRSYLIQLHRLAAYLQAGLLVVQDAEGLTLRATRAALAKLDANPERLLG